MLEEFGDYSLAAAGCDAARYLSALPAGLPFDTRRCLIGGNHRRGTDFVIDAPGFRGERLRGAAEYVGDGAFADSERMFIVSGKRSLCPNNPLNISTRRL